MAKKLTIAEPAVREKKSGKVHPAPSKAWSHDQLEAKLDTKKSSVKEGFFTNTGKFVNRKKAAKIAKKAGEIKNADGHIKKLHSTDLRRALHIKKKVL